MGDEPPRYVFEDVVEEFSGPLLRYLQRLVGDRSTADDLLQDTLLKIARALPGFEGRSSIKTWAFTIATRVATDHLRRPQSRARMVDIDETTHLFDAESDQKLVIDEMSSCMREVIDSLPEDYRTALIVGCSLAAAKIRIHRSRQRLKQALEKECRFYRDAENVFRCDRKLDT